MPDHNAELTAIRARVMSALNAPLPDDDKGFAALSRSSMVMAFEKHVDPYGLTPITLDVRTSPGAPS